MPSVLRTRMITVTLVLAATTMTGVGCTTTPNAHAPRPWIDVTPGSVAPATTSVVDIDVTGENHSLLGAEDPRIQQVSNHVARALSARGYQVSASSGDVHAHFIYSTSPTTRLFTQNSASHSAYRFGSATALGLGAYVAQAVHESSSSTTATTQRSEEVAVHQHRLALEFRADDRVVWTSNAMWESSTPDIQDDLDYALALMVSSLPHNDNELRRSPQLRTSHIETYYKENCEGVQMRSIAIPNYVRFPDRTSTGLPGRIKNPEALPAYVDLIQSADMVVPIGLDVWTNPASPMLWSSLLLGSEFELGPDGDRVYAMIELSGRTSGYLVRKAWLADQEEYTEYLNALDDWRNAVSDYYDWFER